MSSYSLCITRTVRGFIFSFLMLKLIKADHIICNSTHPCDTSLSTIACIEDGDCLIECIGANACSSFQTIHCANNGACTVRCNGSYACSNDTHNVGIGCPYAPHSCTIECQGNRACNARYHGSTIGQESKGWNYGGDLTVLCLGDPTSDTPCWLMDTYISCPDAPYSCNVTCVGRCYKIDIGGSSSGAVTVNILPGHTFLEGEIWCSSHWLKYPCHVTIDSPFGTNSGSWGKIIAGTGDLTARVNDMGNPGCRFCSRIGCDEQFMVCNITCTGACLNGEGDISAQWAAELNLFIETSNPLAISDRADITCPKNDGFGATQNCNIYVSTPQGSVDFTNVDIRAVEGIHDLKFICNQDDGNCTFSVAPTLYCVSYSSQSCTLGLYPSNSTPIEWRCTEGSTCDTYLLPTYSPTAFTANPTNGPTLNPTRDPTRDPTTIEPTIDPTLDPSIDPTIDPSVDPSVDPTIDPTIDPSTWPTAQTIYETEGHKDVAKPGLPHSQMILLFWAFGVTLALVFATCVGLLCWQQMRIKAMQVQINVLSDENDGDAIDGANSQQDTETANSQANPVVIVQRPNPVLLTPPKEESSSDDDGIYGGPPKEAATGEEVKAGGKGSHLVEDVDEGRDYTELSVWMKHVVGLEQYTQTMIETGYEDINTLSFITMDDLKEAGIANVAHRQRIYDLAQQKPQTTATTQHQTELQATAAQQKPKQIQFQTTDATPHQTHDV
eukprot:502448_1